MSIEIATTIATATAIATKKKKSSNLIINQNKIKYSKFKYQHLNLNKASSKLFLTDSEDGISFRNKVVSQIANPNKQLSLNLSNSNQ